MRQECCIAPRHLRKLGEELADALAALEDTWADLAREREQVAELEARVAQPPRSSSGPPSSEGLAKPTRKRAITLGRELHLGRG